MAESFQERIARRRAAFEAEWQRDHGPRTLTNDDPINPHKHVADTERGTQCMARTDGLCFIAHDCKCPILFACMGGCYRTEVWRSYHPNRPVQHGPQLPYDAVPVGETVDCTECEQTFAVQPADFIRYDRWRDRWVTKSEEDGTVLPLHGVCGRCQKAIEASRDIYGGRGTERIEQRTIEDEQYVWER